MKKVIKTKIMYYLLGFISAIGIVSVFAYSYVAQEIGFSPKASDWDVDNVRDALDSFRDIASYCPFGCPHREGDVVYSSDFIDRESTYTPECFGKFKLEVWGAQGGSYDSTYFGGYGGYAVGVININTMDPLYINVGEAGIGGVPGPTKIDDSYNGGGGSPSHSDGNEKRASGGGATHIATKSGELYELVNERESAVIIVAGGGGGAQVNSAILSTAYSYGGHGGGFKGTSATGKTPNGGGGTQLAGGSGDTAHGIDGSFGKGGYGANAAGGGGGWYGGGAANRGGGGGSGYIASSRLVQNTSNQIVNKLYCYSCEETDSLNSYTVSTYGTTTHENDRNAQCTNGVSSEPISGCAKKGNGYVRITYLGTD